MPGLDAASIEALVDGMALGGRLDSITMSSMLKIFVGDCAEAYVGAAAAAARALEAGPVDLGGGSSAHALPTGSPYELGMGLVHAGERFVVVVGLSGKPDPAFDAMFDDMLRDMGMAPSAGEPRPRPVPSPNWIRAAKAGADEAAVLANLVADKWMPDLVLEAGVSHPGFREEDGPPGPDDPWDRGTRDLDDFCAWASLLQALDRAVVATGNGDLLDEACRAMAARRWAVQAGFPPTVAGAALAVDCGFRPGERGVTLVDAIQDRACELDLARCAGMLLGLGETCGRHGHVGEDGAYDLGTDAYAFTLADDGATWVLRLDTQSRNIAAVVRLAPAGDPVAMEVHQRPSRRKGDAWGADAFGMDGSPRARAVAPATLVASFAVSDGAFRIVTGPGNDIDRIRAWNGFEANVHNAHHAFQAEYGASPMP